MEGRQQLARGEGDEEIPHSQERRLHDVSEKLFSFKKSLTNSLLDTMHYRERFEDWRKK